MNMTPTLPETPFFHLIVGNGNSLEVDNASVPVRWCLNEPMIDAIKEMAGTMPVHVALTAIHPVDVYGNGTRFKYEELSRVVVPITDAMAYIMINRPGKFYIHASVLVPYDDDLSNKSVSKMANELCERENSGHLKRKIELDSRAVDDLTNPDNFYDILSEDNISSRFKSILYRLHAWNHAEIKPERITNTIECFCPESLFAAQLPSWLVSWVNMPFNSKMVDQCSFRRRLMLFLVLTWWAFPLVALVIGTIYFGLKLFCGIFLNFLGFTNIKWKTFIEGDYDEFTNNKHWRNMYANYPLLIPLHPILWVPEYYVAKWLASIEWLNLFSWLWDILTASATNIAIAVGIVIGTVFVVEMFIAMITGIFAFNATGSNRDRFYMSPIWGRLFDRFWAWTDRVLFTSTTSYDNLLCGGDPLAIVANPKSLPKPRSTIVLAYKNIKAKVCKPMAL